MTTRESPAGQEFTRLFAGLEGGNDQPVETDAEAPHTSPIGWRGVPWLESDAAANPDLWTDRLAWLDLGDEPPPIATLDLGPADAAAIGQELGLAPELSAEMLHRKRRAFALSNHPDRFPAGQRELATQRMRIANMLIDAALRQAAHDES